MKKLIYLCCIIMSMSHIHAMKKHPNEQKKGETYSFEKTGEIYVKKGVLILKYGCMSKTGPCIVWIDHIVNENDGVYGFNICLQKKGACKAPSVCLCKITDAKVLSEGKDYVDFAYNSLKAHVIDALKLLNHKQDDICWFSVIKKSYEEYCGKNSKTTYHKKITGEEYSNIITKKTI